MTTPNPDDLSPELNAQLEEYRSMFRASLHHRIEALRWEPYRVLKVFKHGVHWIVTLHQAGTVHYWVESSWRLAAGKAEELAAQLRESFAPRYAQRM